MLDSRDCARFRLRRVTNHPFPGVLNVKQFDPLIIPFYMGDYIANVSDGWRHTSPGATTATGCVTGCTRAAATTPTSTSPDDNSPDPAARRDGLGGPLGRVLAAIGDCLTTALRVAAQLRPRRAI